MAKNVDRRMIRLPLLFPDLLHHFHLLVERRWHVRARRRRGEGRSAFKRVLQMWHEMQIGCNLGVA